jgi:hypothetical protein
VPTRPVAAVNRKRTGNSTTLVTRRGPRATRTIGDRISSRVRSSAGDIEPSPAGAGRSAGPPPRYSRANSAPAMSNSGSLGRATTCRTSSPARRRPCSIRSNRSKAGKRPPATRPERLAGVPQYTDRRSWRAVPPALTDSASARIAASSDSLSGSCRIRPRSTSLTIELKPPWAKLPRAYIAMSRSPRASLAPAAAAARTNSPALASVCWSGMPPEYVPGDPSRAPSPRPR